MPRLADDRALRENVRRNVGRPNDPFLIHPARAIAPRRVVSPSGAGLPPPAPTALPGAAIAGRSVATSLRLATGNRGVAVTPLIGYPFQLRKITLMGTAAINTAISYRLFMSDDADTTALVTPTGDELVLAFGDLIGAEDAGIHAALSVGPVTFEPYTICMTTGRVFKLKVHNVTGATHDTAAYFDLDELQGLAP